ncbi:MAG TPA: AarF/ABC1/UbiB kinase family protein [Anaerolineales bacterium]|nr:AarF/ABC1/UbiB kinase family protein [Anaerolineales bacterium]
MIERSNLANADQQSGVLSDLPRRKLIEVSAEDSSLSQMRFIAFKVNHLRSLISFLRWLQLFFYFYLNILMDVLLGRDTPKRRATRLRRAFERNGGAFVKLGIHLSLRLDFMPWVYSNELSCMTDRMEPFPVKQAVATIERSLGKPFTAIFSSFDPDPIESSSVACIYQAFLQTGEKVIVKVRRPGIGEQFTADLEAFDWLLSFAELLTIFRPGFTREMRLEFRTLLLEELDFVQEARRQDSFRRAAANSRMTFFTANRIHLNLTTEEVVVNEFASGIWLWELLAAVEHGNESVMARAREMNIDPKLVAKRLLWVNYWSWSENLFFHGDPNPDSVIVTRDSTLHFINFASTGTLSRSKQQALRKNLKYAWERDPQNMARATLVLLEPLPPIDLIELAQELETYNWQLLYALEATPHSVTWQERTSAIQWAGMMQLVRKYGVVIDIHILRFIRSTLLLESMAVRLYREINFVNQFRKFEEYRAEQARRRVTDAIMGQMDGKGSEQAIIRLDRVAYAMENLLFRTSHMLSLPSVNFNSLMSKWSYAIYMVFRFAGHALFLTLGAAIVVGLQLYFQAQEPITMTAISQSVITNPIYQVLMLITIFVNGRTVLFRLDDKETQA